MKKPTKEHDFPYQRTQVECVLEMVECPACGELLSDHRQWWGGSVLSLHVSREHSSRTEGVDKQCWCGDNFNCTTREHIHAHGGYDQHYEDLLMGVSANE